MRIACACSHVQRFVTPWTIHGLPGLSRQECWSGLLFPPPGDLPDPGIEGLFRLLCRQAGSFPLAPPGEPQGLQGER